MTGRSFDTVVVGLGAMGSASLYQLAKRGQSVLGIDRYRPPHTHGSSHGETRVTRLANGEGDVYVPLALRSQALWREIEAETGADLLNQCGVMILASQTGAAKHHGKANFVRNTIQGARRHAIRHEVLDAAEIGDRFPQFRLTGNELGYFEPDGGYVHPERCIEAQLRLARRHGARVQLDTTVLGLEPEGAGATTITLANGDRISAGQVVMSAGSWTGGLLGATADGLAGHLRICRQVLHWFDVENPADFVPGRFPVFIWMHGEEPEDYFYGFPVPPGGNGVKLASEQYGESLADPDRLDRLVQAVEQQSMFMKHVDGRLIGIRPKVLRSAACMYTLTPDAEFVVDWHPGDARVMIVSACSGHGFKHSAALGEAVARGIVDGSTGLDAFGVARLLQAASH